MTLNHDENSCTALNDNQSESTYHSNCRQAAKDAKKTKRNNPHALDPDIIPPAAESVEEDINSEFYPSVYIP